MSDPLRGAAEAAGHAGGRGDVAGKMVHGGHDEEARRGGQDGFAGFKCEIHRINASFSPPADIAHRQQPVSIQVAIEPNGPVDVDGAGTFGTCPFSIWVGWKLDDGRGGGFYYNNEEEKGMRTRRV